jgi:predicted nucleic acid-binding protein
MSQMKSQKPFDDTCSKTYGPIRAKLKRIGQPIRANDLMIAAMALNNNCTLVTQPGCILQGGRLTTWRLGNLRLPQLQGFAYF